MSGAEWAALATSILALCGTLIAGIFQLRTKRDTTELEKAKLAADTRKAEIAAETAETEAELEHDAKMAPKWERRVIKLEKKLDAAEEERRRAAEQAALECAESLKKSEEACAEALRKSALESDQRATIRVGAVQGVVDTLSSEMANVLRTLEQEKRAGRFPSAPPPPPKNRDDEPTGVVRLERAYRQASVSQSALPALPPVKLPEEHEPNDG